MSLFFLAVGLFTHGSALIAWFLHWTLVSTAESTSYGVDLYGHFVLFYLIFVPSGNAWSVDSWRAPGLSAPSPWARLGLRTIQIHLCISYFASALEKAAGVQWWNGELLWRALNLPEYRQFDLSWLAYWPLLPKLGGWIALALEAGYCLLIWPRQTRRIWVAGMIGLHLGIAVFLGLGLFGVIMAVLTFAVFGISAEPQWHDARTTSASNEQEENPLRGRWSWTHRSGGDPARLPECEALGADGLGVGRSR